jgi:hypothetical protein
MYNRYTDVYLGYSGQESRLANARTSNELQRPGRYRRSGYLVLTGGLSVLPSNR